MQNHNLKTIIKFGAVFGLLIFLHFLHFTKPLENFLVKIINPLAQIFYKSSAGIRNNFLETREKKDLIADNQELQKINSELIIENAQLKMLVEENQELRNHLNFLEKKDIQYVMANIIGRGSFYQSGTENIILIDKGRKDGVFPNLALVSSRGIIIGKIKEVEDYFAKAYLITDKNCKLAVAITGEEKTIGVAEGNLGLTVKMNFIPQTQNILENDLVMSSGLEEYIPAGLIVGKIIKLEKENNDVWQNAIIEPLVDVNNLQIVSVLIP